MSELLSDNVKASAPNRSMLRRILALMLLFGIVSFSVLLARLYRLQIVDHAYYEELAVRQQLREAPTTVRRGSIYDRKGTLLAVSASVDNVYVSPAEIAQHGEDRRLIAAGLSAILGLDEETVYEKTGQTGSWYVTVKRKIEREEADAVRRFKLDNGLHGVHLEPDSKRYYPFSSLACHVIGFVGIDNTGLEGIEAMYDTALTGERGRTLRLTNAYGADLLLNQYENIEEGKNGCDLVLTIDSTIQYYIEKCLKQAVADYDIRNGAGAIAMDVNTGAILAMASIGGYDLNDFLAVGEEEQAAVDAAATPEEAESLLRTFQTRQWRNKALSDTYEPGSTFKIITLAMALDSGAVRLNDGFFCGGSVTVPGRTNPIRCWKSGGHGSQTLTQAVQHSCNAAFVNIGLRVGAERFYQYCEAFGFLKLSDNPDAGLTATTGVDLAGESGSIWWSENTFYSRRNLSQLAAASFGQTFTITPLQLITAVSACVNGGKLMRPYVVQRIVSPEGEVLMDREPVVVRRVISEETSETVRSILEQVVGDPKEGTGRNAAVAGYRIGGKTGTSEKVSLEAQTGQKQYIVSFIGFAPADDPQIAILVFLDTPGDRSGVYVSGGQMAAPVVGRMMADILPYLGVEPSLDLSDAQADKCVPSLLGLSRGEAEETIRQGGLRWRSVGEGERVTAQLPPPGVMVAAGTQMIVYYDSAPIGETVSVPDLSGMSYSDARNALEACGLFIRTWSPVADAAGQAVFGQSIPAGTSVGYGSIVEVALSGADAAMLGRY
ncbi:MAG: PASTA domain-containing protein [Oscillospiraceae bacterium]|nr:PASTA domain-containing protein [Oscillospiraceae bacterium]